jgi:hypothetical protein
MLLPQLQPLLLLPAVPSEDDTPRPYLLDPEVCYILRWCHLLPGLASMHAAADGVLSARNDEILT